eukprot:GHRR01002819.1.p1 GENE.GHRR01002819.1~~GHRR01002819.1.p1  ORF type:complete len:221 (+),score=38.30 GHRR01002819.1:334-996(+)
MQRISRSNTLFDGREFEHILIDLDDTLYRSEHIPVTVKENIQNYMINKLGIPANKVGQMTQELYCTYGTTMAGLVATGVHIDYDDWHAHVHGALDYTMLLESQPATKQVLTNMTLQRHILTNAGELVDRATLVEQQGRLHAADKPVATCSLEKRMPTMYASCMQWIPNLSILQACSEAFLAIQAVHWLNTHKRPQQNLEADYTLVVVLTACLPLLSCAFL